MEGIDAAKISRKFLFRVTQEKIDTGNETAPRTVSWLSVSNTTNKNKNNRETADLRLTYNVGIYIDTYLPTSLCTYRSRYLGRQEYDNMSVDSDSLKESISTETTWLCSP